MERKKRRDVKRVSLPYPAPLLRRSSLSPHDMFDIVYSEEHRLPSGGVVYVYLGRYSDGRNSVGVMYPEELRSRRLLKEVEELLSAMREEFLLYGRITFPSGKVLDCSVDPPVFKS